MPSYAIRSLQDLLSHERPSEPNHDHEIVVTGSTRVVARCSWEDAKLIVAALEATEKERS